MGWQFATCALELLPAVPLTSIFRISKDQMVEADRVMIEDLGSSLVQTMENAGRNLARSVMDAYVSGGLVAAGRLVDIGAPASMYSASIEIEVADLVTPSEIVRVIVDC